MTIKQVQLLLTFLGYDPGPTDGLNGPRTQRAVLAFQRDLPGLDPSGIPEEKTWNALRQAVARGIPEPPPPASADFWKEIRYFTRSEFACKCGDAHTPYCDGYPAEMQEAAVRLCDEVRTHFGRPGYIVSGLRCPQHNADSGGVANSQHMAGEAVDLRVEGVPADRLLAFIRTRPGVRYAYQINETNIHFDIPPSASGT